MDSSNNFKLGGFKDLLKKPAFLVGGVVVVLLLLLFTLFGGGGGQDPTAKGLQDLSNQHEATLSLIDSYSKDVRSDNLRSTLSQVSIILTADKNEIDLYYTEVYSLLKDVRSTVSTKPDKELIEALDDAAILNNLDSALKTAVVSELKSLQSSIQELRRQNTDKDDLVALMQKINLNTQTVVTRLEEVR